jgi:hypothetical protein
MEISDDKIAKDIFEINELNQATYFVTRYLVPVFFCGGIGIMFVTALFCYFRSSEAANMGLIVMVAALGAVLIVVCCLLVPQIFLIKMVRIAENGVGFDNKFFLWSEVTRMKQVFVFRINFYCQHGSGGIVFSMPVNYESWNTSQWPNSEIYEKVDRIRRGYIEKNGRA